MSTETSNISVSPSSISIKKELDNDKEFEENPINELLGWYGYENDSRPESTRPNINNNNNNNNHANSDMSKQEEEKKNREARKQRLLKCVAEITPIIRQSMESNSVECSESICNWCKKKISDTSSEFTTAHDGFKYCSEFCFAQNRRASFKKAKTCDWCKHIRHTVNYVDFQDGASQLQFCSDKCLNQYKMQLFCKETQAHLDMNPHLKDRGIDKPDTLITPELWLKNCRSRSGSPTSSLSSSNTPQLKLNDSQMEKPLITVTNIQKLLDESNHYPPPINKRKLMKSRKRRVRLPVSESCQPVLEQHHHHNSEPIRPTRPPNLNINANQGSQPNFNMMPPITVMVPYPVIIPLPIPVPIPIWDIHKAYCENNKAKSGNCNSAETTSKPVEPEETELERQSVMKPKDFPNNNKEKDDEEDNVAAPVAEERQMVPKLKITRLQSRRITESSRPLRKRKLVNSEYMRVLSSSKNTENN
ncbi:SOBP family protein [Megaselia abdita]